MESLCCNNTNANPYGRYYGLPELMREQIFDEVPFCCQRPVNLSSRFGQKCLTYIVRLGIRRSRDEIYDRFLLHEVVNMAHNHSWIAVR
jgi:hypothetical protein